MIDLSRMRGLEIGALHNPRLPVGHPNVSFVDHAPAEELRGKYSANAHMLGRGDDIVDVDYVWARGRTLQEAVGDDAPFDFVLAAHVIEHIPDPIGWLQQIAAVLTPGGVLSLVVPDKRYCFDFRRQLTTPAQLIDAHLRRLEVPSYQQIFDHEAGFVDIDAERLWSWADVGPVQREDVADAEQFAFERCLAHQRSGEYVDVHCTTFTPRSFVETLLLTSRLGLSSFAIARLFPTVPGSFEFYVTLVRLDDAAGADAVRDEAVASCSMALASLAPAPEPVDLSRKELRLILRKRRLLQRLRRVTRFVRRPKLTKEQTALTAITYR